GVMGHGAMAGALRAWEDAAARRHGSERGSDAWSPAGRSGALAAQMRAARSSWTRRRSAPSRMRARLWRRPGWRAGAEGPAEPCRREELRALRDAAGERAPSWGGGVLAARPRCPSLADVWRAADVERYYRHLFLETKLLLQRLSCDNLADVEALPQSWERILERYKDDVVQDTLLKVSLFVENHRELSCSPGS
uniref:Uncharacterized protein n=1 Tax=Malurus cyaneus samueli TaxID=2593467 RepID=A0A8C5UAE2_9PASS